MTKIKGIFPLVLGFLGIIIILILIGMVSPGFNELKATISGITSIEQLAEIPCSTLQECSEIYNIPEGDIRCENGKCYTMQIIG